MKKIHFLILNFVALCLTQLTFAMPVLKHVQVKNSSEFNLVFDGKLSESQVSTEFVNDIFQVNLKNVAVYPAKIIPVQGAYFSKIFAYQYSPKVVRCRFTLRGHAADLKNKIKVKSQGELVTVQVETPSAVTKNQSLSQGETEISPKAATNPKQEAAPEDTSEQDALDEQALLQKVIRGTADSGPVEAKKDLQEDEHDHPPLHEADSIKEKARPLAGAKPLPAIWPVFMKLGGVILLFTLLAAFIKKFKATPRGEAWWNATLRMAKKKFNKSQEMIEVISTHHLDPKKSLAVVKVAGRMLVLGVSNDAINLITQISNDGGEDDLLDFDPPSAAPNGRGLPRMDDPIFADFLGRENIKQSADRVAPKPSRSPSFVPTAKSRIKNRLEGLKPL